MLEVAYAEGSDVMQEPTFVSLECVHPQRQTRPER